MLHGRHDVGAWMAYFYAALFAARSGSWSLWTRDAGIPGITLPETLPTDPARRHQRYRSDPGRGAHDLPIHPALDPVPVAQVEVDAHLVDAICRQGRVAVPSATPGAEAAGQDDDARVEQHAVGPVMSAATALQRRASKLFGSKNRDATLTREAEEALWQSSRQRPDDAASSSRVPSGARDGPCAALAGTVNPLAKPLSA